MGIGDHLSAPGASPKVPVSLQQRLEEACDELLGGSKARFRVKAAWGRPDSQLIGLARAGKADLVVLGGRMRGNAEQSWLGSVSRGVFYYAPFDVVCVPTAATTPGKSLGGHAPTPARHKGHQTSLRG